MIGKLIPKYTVTDEVGYSGDIAWTWGFGPRKHRLIYISKHRNKIQNLNINYKDLGSMNPFRYLQSGGTSIGKYWISDDCLIGKIVKFIFE